MTELMQKWQNVRAINTKIKNTNCALVINCFTDYRDKITDITIAFKTRKANTYEIRPTEKSMYVLLKPIPITADMLKDQAVMWNTVRNTIIKGHKKILAEGESVEIGDYLEAMYKNNLIRKIYPDIDEY